MIYLLTFLWCIPSSIFWFINAEVWILTHAAAGTAAPFPLAVAAAAGQMVTLTSLFWVGKPIVARFPRLERQLQRFDVSKHSGADYTVLAFGSVVGFPPVVAFALVARSLHFRPAIFLLVCACGRLTRFSILAHAPETFRHLFGIT